MRRLNELAATQRYGQVAQELGGEVVSHGDPEEDRPYVFSFGDETGADQFVRWAAKNGKIPEGEIQVKKKGTDDWTVSVPPWAEFKEDDFYSGPEDRPEADPNKLPPELRDIYDEAVRIAEDDLRIYVGYSGRGMEGKESPLAIVTEIRPRSAQGEELTNLGFYSDNLGRDYIYYLRGIPRKRRGGDEQDEATAPTKTQAYDMGRDEFEVVIKEPEAQETIRNGQSKSLAWDSVNNFIETRIRFTNTREITAFKTAFVAGFMDSAEEWYYQNEREGRGETTEAVEAAPHVLGMVAQAIASMLLLGDSPDTVVDDVEEKFGAKLEGKLVDWNKLAQLVGRVIRDSFTTKPEEIDRALDEKDEVITKLANIFVPPADEQSEGRPKC